ncbi:site-specific DNA-methyltransferase [Thauera sp.]|uniref:site-specific DNA-methyltransferase n=1 Tax=Thauera sp. TaxID=1905334 RepID=UPI0026353972|nr:site-specific DNA-methyltransferase [Thauera sp.]
MPILDWLNKRQALQAAAAVPYRLIDVDAVHGDPAADNWLIQGDNLDALKALLPFHAGRVKCIYIDPPYNTRSAFEHYDDNLEHSQWLSMMAPRLELLRELLAEDGSIWVSIDDNEGHYLKVLMDEVFGRGNFIATAIWKKNHARNNSAQFLSADHDFVLAYAKKLSNWVPNKVDRTEASDGDFWNPDNDPRGEWRRSDLTAAKPYNDGHYEVVGPYGDRFAPRANRAWSLSKETFDSLLADDRIWWGKTGRTFPFRKRFRSELGQLVPTTIWLDDEVGNNREAKQEITRVFGRDMIFGTPKPERLVNRVLHIATNPGDLVLDSFLGSGTTAAVAHKMGRRYIGIEMGEHAHTHCLPRLQKVIAGEQGGISKAVDWQGGGGVRFARLGAPVFLPDGQVDPAIGFATLAAWIWYQETRTPWRPQTADAQPASPLLGVHEGRAYFLLFNGVLGDRRPQGGNVLTSAVAALLDEAAAGAGVAAGTPRVVFGEACRLSEMRRRALGIDFRQIPYDIRARQEAPAWR